ncbi:MAG: hypothetical protein MUC54_03145, partial [Chloroflexi bacterium]|nr:hypothetical protein [Chloroflexota bacterium]
MTNRIRAGAMLLVATLVAAACSSGASPAPSGAASEAPGSPAAGTITLVLQHMETPQFRVDAFQKAIDGFNASQSKYFVKQETVDWGSAYQRVTAQLQAGNVADMQ